jgi:glucokinase
LNEDETEDALLLAGDIGGTKTVIASFRPGPSGPQLQSESTFRSGTHASLGEILESFLGAGTRARVTRACFGVAGPVIEGRASITNLPWDLDERELAEVCGAPTELINDLAANAYGMPALQDEQRVTLNDGRERAGNIAVIAAGTGLGQALLYWDGSDHRVIASEGGHAGFAPRTDEQIELLRFLSAEFGGRVSTERVLSGPGLHNIYRFVRETGSESESAEISARFAAGDPSAVVAELALDGADPICQRSLELFASIYGAEAGDLALRTMAFGGVYLGGGIAPKILPALRGSAFLEAFCDKGRFARRVAEIPIHVALEPRTALLGAARRAAEFT